jgi:phosphatidylethanolamine/phosphatidyl-N-methylethanolamine N-methyltransferase
VDLSEDMLRRARMKVEQRGLSHVKSLQVMDVCRLGFADQSFDAVAAQFLITLVPDPEGALDEFARVLRPGGEIVMVNHWGQPAGILARLEDFAAPVAKQIGWSSNFKASRVERWAAAKGNMEVLVFKIMRLRKCA